MHVSPIAEGIVAPALGLAGTLLVALLGYRQWRKQQDLARYGTFLSDRQAAYKALWQKLEAVHLSVRSNAFDEEEFHRLVREVNLHLIEVGLLLDRGEKERVNGYMGALGDLGRVLENEAAASAKEQARRSLYDTGPLPPDVMDRVDGLRTAFGRAEERREYIITHFRQVLGAEHFK